MYDSLPLFRGLPERKSVLHVVTCISNPCRYYSRYKLYEHFAKMVANAGAVLWTVEAAYGNRPFMVTEEGNPCHLQLRTNHEIWHKENMLNLMIERLPQDWEYVAWIDADISFARPDWVEETIQLLQHYKVIQMFSNAFDLDPEFEPFQRHKGFIYSYVNGITYKKDYSNWHPGFAWAARRDAINDLGGLLDFAILGAGDRHMALCLAELDHKLHPKLTKNYKDGVYIWQDRCHKYIRKNIGYIPGTILHYWHGKKVDRKYGERWSILTKNQYDPEIDLKKDWQGLWQLTDRSIKLRDDIRKYFRGRNEDSIDVDFDKMNVKL